MSAAFKSLDEIRELIADRISMADDDPEVGHALIDALCVEVIHQVADNRPDAHEAAGEVQALLNAEEDSEWTRWYA